MTTKTLTETERDNLISTLLSESERDYWHDNSSWVNESFWIAVRDYLEDKTNQELEDIKKELKL